MHRRGLTSAHRLLARPLHQEAGPCTRPLHQAWPPHQGASPSTRPLHQGASPRLLHCTAPSAELRLAPRALFLHTQRGFFSSNKEEEPKVEAEVAPEVSEAEKALQDRIAELEEKHAEVFDKYRRSLADFENLRNRMNKQVADAKVFGIQGFCKDLLEVADVLNKAVGAVPAEALGESQYLRDMHTGLQLTETQLLKVFGKHGLVQENPLGEKFDPNKHDALFQIPAPGSEPNTVLDVQKVGYILQGRTIRPAAVGVSKP